MHRLITWYSALIYWRLMEGNRGDPVVKRASVLNGGSKKQSGKVGEKEKEEEREKTEQKGRQREN
jgi:hypothetical protein